MACGPKSAEFDLGEEERTQLEGLAHRLDGLIDLPHSGAPRVVEDTAIEAMITLTPEGQPENATHGSTRAMAKRVGKRVEMSQTMVSRVWRAFGLQPHRTGT